MEEIGKHLHPCGQHGQQDERREYATEGDWQAGSEAAFLFSESWLLMGTVFHDKIKEIEEWRYWIGTLRRCTLYDVPRVSIRMSGRPKLGCHSLRIS